MADIGIWVIETLLCQGLLTGGQFSLLGVNFIYPVSKFADWQTEEN